MKPKTAHITIQGRPLCEMEDHHGGLLLQSGFRGWLTCSYRSIAEATRAKREVQKHRHTVKVVIGECPGSPA